MAGRGSGSRRRRRLSRSGEFDRVYRDGTSHANRHLVLYAFPRRDDDDGEVRLGLSVGRKVGGAAERNRVKRALREAFWDRAGGLPDGHDFVIVARPGIEALHQRDGAAGVQQSLDEVIRESGIDLRRST